MRSTVRIVLVFVVLLAGAGLYRYWVAHPELNSRASSTPNPIGTSGTVDNDRAGERFAEFGEKAAAASAKVEEKAEIAAAKVQETVRESGISTKIKAKMALDDSVKALNIDVSTTGSTVTLAGQVRSAAEHDRALALARETKGVTHVIDHLLVRPE